MKNKRILSVGLVLFLLLSYAVWYYITQKELVCHLESATGTRSTISVHKLLVNKHLNHGDFIGTCEESRTYVPDDAFEGYLIYMGYDDVLDDYVLTANISSVERIYFEDADEYRYDLPYFQLNDLTGLEDFIGLKFFHLDINHLVYGDIDFSNNTLLETLELDGAKFSSVDLSNNFELKNVRFDGDRFLTSIDLSQNRELENVWVSTSTITRLNLKNGNNTMITRMFLTLNDSACIQVDNTVWATANWPAGYTYSESCF